VVTKKKKTTDLDAFHSENDHISTDETLKKNSTNCSTDIDSSNEHNFQNECNGNHSTVNEIDEQAKNEVTDKKYGMPLEMRKKPQYILDIDAKADPSCSNVEYSDEYFLFIQKTETEKIPNNYFASFQLDIKPKMRAILIDWLVEVVEQYRLHSSTLFLCVNLVDRALNYLKVPRQKLQLVGCACLFISAKYEEIYPPSVQKFVEVCDNAYTKEQILEMESQILEPIKYKISGVTMFHFIDRFCAAAELNQREKEFAKYLCELMMLRIEFMLLKPSLLVASAIHLTLQTFRVHTKQVWTASLVHYTDYTAFELEPYVRELNRFHYQIDEIGLQAIKTKYSRSSRYHASQITALPMEELRFIDVVIKP